MNSFQSLKINKPDSKNQLLNDSYIILQNPKIDFKNKRITFRTKNKNFIIENSEYFIKIVDITSEIDGSKSIKEIIAATQSKQKEVLDLFKFLIMNKIVTKSYNQSDTIYDILSFPDIYLSSLIENNKVFEKKADSIPQLPSFLNGRKSNRLFDPNFRFTHSEITNILLAMHGNNSYKPYASAGSIYSSFLIYTDNFNINSFDSIKFYKFDPQKKVLDKNTIFKIISKEDLVYAFNDKNAYNGSLMILLCSNISLHTNKYSNRGYKFSLIENWSDKSKWILICMQ